MSVRRVARDALAANLDVSQIPEVFSGNLGNAFATMRLPPVEPVNQHPAASNRDRWQLVDGRSVALNRRVVFT